MRGKGKDWTNVTANINEEIRVKKGAKR